MSKLVPMELNEENVLKIYNDCLMKKKLLSFLSSDLLSVKVFTRQSCGKDSPEIYFSKSKIQEHKYSIEYLYGQLDNVHKNMSELLPAAGALRYDEKLWTKNQATLMSFYYLGVANITIMPFVIQPISNNISVDLVDITPTLSPNDPNYKG